MRRILVASLAACAAVPAFAVFPNQAENNSFRSVGLFGTSASAVAVGKRQFLSAQHVDAPTITLNGTVYNVLTSTQAPVTGTWTFLDGSTSPDRADLRVLQVDKDIPDSDITPMFFGNITGQQVTMVGFGDTGTQTANGYSVSGGAGTRRAAVNRVDGLAVIGFGQGVSWLTYYYTLDNPSASGYIQGEGGVAGGDSGGGWFVNDGGVWKVAGISSAIGRLDGNSALGNFDWGGNGFAVALGQYQPWLTSAVPEPFTLTALALAALVARRRNKKK